MATTTVYPRLFEISITFTFRAGYLKRVIDTATVHSRLFEFRITLTVGALHRHKHVPASFNHSLYLTKLFNSSSTEGHCGGNQLLDGSVCLSPLSTSITNDLHVSIATPPGRFSPDFAILRLRSPSFKSRHSCLTRTTSKITEYTHVQNSFQKHIQKHF